MKLSACDPNISRMSMAGCGGAAACYKVGKACMGFYVWDGFTIMVLLITDYSSIFSMSKFWDEVRFQGVVLYYYSFNLPCSSEF